MRHAQPPPLSADDTLAHAVRLVLWEGLDHLAAHLEASRRGEAEAIHQARVAMRRLRSALKLLRRHLDPASRDGFNDALRRLGRILGGARDWDVFIDETVPLVRRSMPGHDLLLDGLLPAAAILRTRAHAALRETLEAPLTGLLLEDLRVWAAGDHAVTDNAGASIGKEAPRLLAGLARTVRRRGRHLAGHGDEERHALRKALKGLRYGMQMLEALHEGEAPRSYRKALGGLQDDLGTLNDASAAAELTGHLPDLPGTAVVTAWSEARRRAVLATLPAAWEAFRSIKPYW